MRSAELSSPGTSQIRIYQELKGETSSNLRPSEGKMFSFDTTHVISINYERGKKRITQLNQWKLIRNIFDIYSIECRYIYTYRFIIARSRRRPDLGVDNNIRANYRLRITEATF